MWKKMWKRLMNIFKAKANATLDELENPIEMYKLGIAEFEHKLKQSEAAIAKLMAQVTLRKGELEQFKLEVEQRHAQAKQAVNINNQELAQQALVLKGNAENKVKEYIAIVQMLEGQVVTLRKDHERNKKSLKDKQTKYQIYKAKYESALTQKEVASSMSDLGGETALSNLNNYEKQIEQMSAEASAYDEMSNANQRLDTSLEDLAIEAQVIDQMEELRIENEFEKKKKQEERQNKITKLMFGETKKIDVPKQNLELPKGNNNVENIFEQHFKEDKKNDNAQKINDFFNK